MWGTKVARGAWLQYGSSMAAVHWGQAAVLWFSVGLQPSLLQCCCVFLCWGACCTTGFVVGWETRRGPSCETSDFLLRGRRSCMEGEGAFWQLRVLLSTKILSSSPVLPPSSSYPHSMWDALASLPLVGHGAEKAPLRLGM